MSEMEYGSETNVTKENRANKGEVKWTKKRCIGVTFISSWF